MLAIHVNPLPPLTLRFELFSLIDRYSHLLAKRLITSSQQDSNQYIMASQARDGEEDETLIMAPLLVEKLQVSWHNRQFRCILFRHVAWCTV